MKVSKSDVGSTAPTGHANRAPANARIDSDPKRKVSHGDRKGPKNKRQAWKNTVAADQPRIHSADSPLVEDSSTVPDKRVPAPHVQNGQPAGSPPADGQVLLQQAQREARQALSEAERWRERCEASEARLRDRFDEIVLLTRMVLDANLEKHKQTTTAAYLQEQLREKEVRVDALERQVLDLTGELAAIEDLFQQMVRNVAVKAVETELHERSIHSTSRFARKKKKLSVEERDLAMIQQSALFDTSWYVANYEDVKLSGIDPALHYLRHGATEGRDPGPVFSTSGYLHANQDVKQANLNPLLHFLRHGAAEGRKIGKTKESE
jgi:hypothetical protein